MKYRITFTSPFSFDKTEIQSGIVTAESVSEVMDIYADCNVLTVEEEKPDPRTIWGQAADEQDADNLVTMSDALNVGLQ